MNQAPGQPDQQSVAMRVEVGISEDVAFFVFRLQCGTILTQAWVPMQLADHVCELIQIRKREAVGKIVPANAKSLNVSFDMPKADEN